MKKKTILFLMVILLTTVFTTFSFADLDFTDPQVRQQARADLVELYGSSQITVTNIYKVDGCFYADYYIGTYVQEKKRIHCGRTPHIKIYAQDEVCMTQRDLTRNAELNCEPILQKTITIQKLTRQVIINDIKAKLNDIHNERIEIDSQTTTTTI